MYESPISITEITDNIIKKQNEQFENDLMYQIRINYHIDVDKEQLIRALQYDREQYEKGYQDCKSAMHDKEEEIDVKEYDLVIIDDLGVENASATAFSIIDEVYSNKIPLIVTTNLTPDKMLRNENLEKRRIYDRLLEACTKKILIKNSGSRAKKGNDNLKDMMEILG